MAISFVSFVKGLLIKNDTDITKEVVLQSASGATTGTRMTITAAQTANRTLTLPDATDTLVGKATTDTLTNKTFDADGTGNSITNIENADIKAGAAIAVNKLAATTASRTLVSDGSGFITAATTTAAEIEFVNGVTSAIQTQIDGKQPIQSGNTDNRVLRADGATGIQQSAVTISDAGAITGLTLDADGAGNAISNIENADIKSGAAIERAKLANGTASHVLINDGSGVMSSEATLSKARGGAGADMSSVTFPATGTLVTRDATETLTNKTLTSPTINSGTLATPTVDVLTLDGQGSTPANPGAGFYKMYVKDSDGKAYKLDSAGNETPLGGSGQGGINYIANPDAESATTGWATYADAAAATPVDGTGGSPNVTLTRTTAINEVIRELSNVGGSFKFAKDAANRQGEGVSYDFDLDRIDRLASRPMTISFDYQTSGNYVSDDIRIFVITDTGGTPVVLNVLNSDSGYLKAANADYSKSGRFVGTFYTESTVGAAENRLVFHIASTNATDYHVAFDNVKVTPDTTMPSAIVTDWESWTPTGSWVANSTYTGLKRRVGADMEYQVKIALSGAPTATNLTVNLPSGDIIDTTRLIHTTSGYSTISGSVGSAVDAGTNGYQLTVAYNNTTSVAIMRNLTTGASGDEVLTGNGVHATEPFTFANGDSVHFFFKVPITGLKSSAAISTTETLVSSAKLSLTKNGAQTVSAATTTKVTTWTVNKDNMDWWDSTNHRYRVQKTGRYLVAGTVSVSSFADEKLEAEIYVNGSLSKTFAATSANTNVTFSIALDLNSNDYIELNVNSTADASYDVNATGTELTITEIADLSVFGVYGNFELLTATSAEKTPSASGHYHALTTNSLTLTPGTWRLSGTGNFSQSGSAAYSNLALYWFAANGADSGVQPALLSTISGLTVLTPMLTDYRVSYPVTTVGIVPGLSIIVRCTTNATIYLVSSANMTTAANARITVYATAERLQ